MVIEAFKQTLETENIQISLKATLQSLYQWTVAKNLTEKEFDGLYHKLPGTFGDKYPFIYDKRDAFTKLQEATDANIAGYNKKIQSIVHQREKAANDFKTKLLLDPEKEYWAAEITEMLQLKEQKINTIENNFKQLEKLLTIEEDQIATDLIQEVSLIKSNVESLQKEVQSQFELNSAQKEKEAATNFISANEENYNRINKGYLVLEKLSGNEGSDQLNTFFEQNMLEIADIFMTIHAPREFKKVIYENNQLFLIDEDNITRTLSEISTGQRAALAISLFISLNRKLKNGPDIILFDDPISHIDDLNVLSFLDFLRFFMVKEGKQIFIATANERLADLVHSKFGFMEDEFREWTLVR